MFFRYNYYVSSDDILVKVSIALFALSFFLRLFWSIAWRSSISRKMLIEQVLLPLAATLLFVVFIWKFGETKLWLTVIPAAMGVIFFMLKARTFKKWHKVLCLSLYTLVILLYGSIVLGVLPVVKLLIPLFGIPLAVHVFYEDPFVMAKKYDAAGWIQEVSVVAIMAGLLLLSLAMKEL